MSARPGADELIAKHRAAVQGRLIGWVVVAATLGLVVGGLLAAGHARGAISRADIAPLLLIDAMATIVGLVVAVTATVSRAPLEVGEALLAAGHHEAAVRQLKRHPPTDEATWLIAHAYDRLGAARLALESYREYLRSHPKGRWVVEARVRLEELERGPAGGAPLQVQAEPSREPKLASHCPYCKDGVGPEAPTEECSACGTTHHRSCYEEQGGCAVYGCKSGPGARGRDAVRA